MMLLFLLKLIEKSGRKRLNIKIRTIHRYIENFLRLAYL
jgi:hypothetical protein